MWNFTMPIYEYKAAANSQTCKKCKDGFEIIQKVSESPLSACPSCGEKIIKLISICRSAIMERSQEEEVVKKSIKSYETSGMWSHAAELADTHSSKYKDKNLKNRALENYKKAGYDADALAKHSKAK